MLIAALGGLRLSLPRGCPVPRSHWLCWVLSGSLFFTSQEAFNDDSYVRSLLNTSVVGGRNPALDSPIFTVVGGGKYPDPTKCDYTTWARCGNSVSNAVSSCQDSYDGWCLRA